jgi:hypothetical protein
MLCLTVAWRWKYRWQVFRCRMFFTSSKRHWTLYRQLRFNWKPCKFSTCSMSTDLHLDFKRSSLQKPLRTLQFRDPLNLRTWTFTQLVDRSIKPMAQLEDSHVVLASGGESTIATSLRAWYRQHAWMKRACAHMPAHSSLLAEVAITLSYVEGPCNNYHFERLRRKFAVSFS